MIIQFVVCRLPRHEDNITQLWVDSSDSQGECITVTLPDYISVCFRAPVAGSTNRPIYYLSELSVHVVDFYLYSTLKTVVNHENNLYV